MQTNQWRAMRRCRARTVARAVLMALAVSWALPCASAAQAPTPPMRLGELYARVVHDNPTVSAAKARARAAEARVPGARRPGDPQIQLGFMNYSLPNLGPMPPLDMRQLQVMQMVPLGGKLAIAGRVADAQAGASASRARDMEWKLRNEAAMAFYDLYAADRQVDVARETLGLLADIGRTAESMYRVGEGRQADVLRATVAIARMAQDTLRMHAMREAAIARINALGNRAAEDPVSNAVRPRFPDSLPLRRTLDSIATSGRPSIVAGMQDVQAADAATALARREIIPDLQVAVQYGQRGSNMTDASGHTSPSIERMGSLMIGASVPIFARDRQMQMRAEAEAMKAMALSELAAMRAETIGGIGETLADLARARDLARLYRTTVLPHAEATVASALASYRVGAVDFMTLLDGQMTVNGYRQELVGLEAEEGKAWARLEMLVGRELLDPNSTAEPGKAPGAGADTKEGAR